MKLYIKKKKKRENKIQKCNINLRFRSLSLFLSHFFSSLLWKCLSFPSCILMASFREWKKKRKKYGDDVIVPSCHFLPVGSWDLCLDPMPLTENLLIDTVVFSFSLIRGDFLLVASFNVSYSHVGVSSYWTLQGFTREAFGERLQSGAWINSLNSGPE